MTQEVDVEEGKLKIVIDLYELVQEIPEKERHKLARIITWDDIMEEAVRRLIDESPDWCSSNDKMHTLNVLSKMEEHVLSGYKWSILQNLDKLAKNLIIHKHLYWKMYHDPIHKDFFRNWLEENKIEDNYITKFKTYLEFKVFIENKLTEFENRLERREKKKPQP